MKISLSESELSSLRRLQRHSPERWMYIRVTTILMLSEGFTVAQVCISLGIDDNTAYEYARVYRSSGISHLLTRDYKGSHGKLSYVQLGRLASRLRSRLFSTAEEVADWIFHEFGIRYSTSGVTSLLHRLNFSHKQTKSIPCEANAERQKGFLAQLDTLLEQPKSALYFTDGVHPTHNTRSLRAWIEKGQDWLLPTVSGRDRVNLNGAVNAHDPTEILIREDARINAQSTKALYQQILDANPDKDVIYVISDNARYYRNRELREWTQETKIVQVFLPPYSPNLNLIERLWKLMRKKVIDPIFYRTKDEFRAGVLSFFQNIAQYEAELKSLLTLNFHTLDSQTHLG